MNECPKAQILRCVLCHTNIDTIVVRASESAVDLKSVRSLLYGLHTEMAPAQSTRPDMERKIKSILSMPPRRSHEDVC